MRELKHNRNHMDKELLYAVFLCQISFELHELEASDMYFVELGL